MDDVELGVPCSVAQGVVQVPGPLHFRTDAGVPALVRHGAPQRFAETHGGLDHAADGSSCGLNGTLDVLSVSDVSAHDLCDCALLSQIVDESPGYWLVRARSAKEHKVARSAPHHPFRQATAEAAQASNHEIALVRAHYGLVFVRYHLEPTFAVFKGHGNFSHAGAEREVPECLSDVRGSEDLEWRAGFGSPCPNEFHALGKQLLPQLVVVEPVGEVQAAQVKGYKRHVAPESGHVEAAMVDDVTFTNLHEAAKVGTCFETVTK